MKHSLKALNSYLFEQLDSLSNGDLSADELKDEINRSKAITDIAKVVVDSSKVVLEAAKHADQIGHSTMSSGLIQDLIEGSNND